MGGRGCEMGGRGCVVSRDVQSCSLIYTAVFHITGKLVSAFPPSRYLFEGLGHLVASIFITSTQYLKTINSSGIKKM